MGTPPRWQRASGKSAGTSKCVATIVASVGPYGLATRPFGAMRRQRSTAFHVSRSPANSDSRTPGRAPSIAWHAPSRNVTSAGTENHTVTRRSAA
jgi:hypothetical protein